MLFLRIVNYLHRSLFSPSVWIFLAIFIICWIFGVINGFPVPTVHDEFSYLLAADTYAHGRIANPPHPLWKYFETFHVLHQPTYTSKYFPAQGFSLAVGKILFGDFAFGIWIGFALMCASIYWMTSQWLSRRWAFVAVLFTVLNPIVGISGYWANSYWGGAVTAAGAALIFGSLPGLLKKTDFSVTLLLGTLLVILSRPFEGAIIFLSVSVILFIKKSLFSHLHNFLLIFFITAGILLTFNRTITGNFFTLPYSLYEQRYSSAPLFIFEKIRQIPSFNNAEMLTYDESFSRQTFLNFQDNIKKRFSYIFTGLNSVFLLQLPFYLGFFALLSGNFWSIFAFLTFSLYLVVSSTLIWFSYHYLAPLIPLYIVFSVIGIKWLTDFKIKNLKIGLILSLYLLLLIQFQITVPALYALTHPANPSYLWSVQRQEIIKQLSATPEDHLVIVRYSPNHSVHHEWVYNEADIDASLVVWARSLDDNQPLLTYYAGRKIWFLDVNDLGTPETLRPY